MKSPLLISFMALCASAVWAQSTPSEPVTSLPAGSAPEVRVQPALPTDAVPVIDVEKLPRTLPPEAKVAYSQTHVPGKVIAITFDDGPHPQFTPRLLDMLKERHIKATFFLIGKSAATWPDVVKRIVAEGHEVANHTWTHPQLNHMSEARVMDELQTTHDAIVMACGVVPLLYRPPYGAVTLSQRKAIHERFGYPTILWDVDPEDWRAPRSIAKVHDRLLTQTRSGSIILCHDIHQPTVDAMPSTLDDLKAKGYQFCTVTQLINLDVETAKQAAAAAALVPAQAAPATPAAPVPATVPSTEPPAKPAPPSPGAEPPVK